jgi:hypothetical protein
MRRAEERAFRDRHGGSRFQARNGDEPPVASAILEYLGTKKI